VLGLFGLVFIWRGELLPEALRGMIYRLDILCLYNMGKKSCSLRTKYLVWNFSSEEEKTFQLAGQSTGVEQGNNKKGRNPET
jgi:hypothetical protein